MEIGVILSGTAVSLIFGFSFLFTKNALDFVPPFTLLSYRFGVAFAFFAFLLLIGGMRFERKPYWKLWKLVLFQPLLYFTFETMGLQRTTSSEAGMIMALIPIVTNVLAFFMLGEKGDVVHYFLVGVGFFGAVMIVGFDLSPGNLLGKAFLVVAVLCGALYTVMARKFSKEFSPQEITFFMMASGFAFFTLLGVASGKLQVSLEPQVWFGALYLGIFSSVVAFYLLNFMVKKASPIFTTLFSNLTTVVSVIAGVVFRNETVRSSQVVGVSLVLLSVFVMSLRGKSAGGN